MRITSKIALAAFILLAAALIWYRQKATPKNEISPLPTTPILISLTPNTTSTPTASPSPTVKLLSEDQVKANFGPCARVPTLMYHHIQPEEQAKALGQTGLTVTPDFLSRQLDYLGQHNYHIIDMNNLASFFNQNTPLPSKPILLTFDDGYQDFYDYAYPILRDHKAKATLFVPTGLMENPNYLSWKEIADMNASGVVYMGNHTWSHHSTASLASVVAKEISTAQTQLSERGLDSLKVFAYPYGSDSPVAEKFLTDNNFQLAFTTRPGRLLCKRQRLSLPRIRIGNASLVAYGL